MKMKTKTKTQPQPPTDVKSGKRVQKSGQMKTGSSTDSSQLCSTVYKVF